MCAIQNGETPLHRAAENSSVRVAQLLLDADGSLDAQDNVITPPCLPKTMTQIELFLIVCVVVVGVFASRLGSSDQSPAYDRVARGTQSS